MPLDPAVAKVSGPAAGLAAVKAPALASAGPPAAGPPAAASTVKAPGDGKGGRRTSAELKAQEEKMSNAVTKTQIAVVHRFRWLIRSWSRIAHVLREQRLLDSQAPSPPFATEEPWSAHVAATARLPGQAASQYGRRPGLQDLDGEVGQASLAAFRQAQEELSTLRPQHDLSDVDTEGSESADSISGHVTQSWKPSGTKVSRYRNPRDKAVGVRQAPPLVWTADDWERRLGGRGLGEQRAVEVSAAVAPSAEPRQDFGFDTRGGDDDAVARAEPSALPPSSAALASQVLNSRLFDAQQKKVLESMMADDRQRRRKLAIHEERENQENAAERQELRQRHLQSTEVIDSVHAGLASVPSLAPVLPLRTQAAELLEARSLLQGLHASVAAGSAGPPIGGQRRYVGTPLPMDMLLATRDYAAGPAPRPQGQAIGAPQQQFAVSGWQLANAAAAQQGQLEKVWL